MVWRGGPTGVGEQGMYGKGSPGTWEASSSPPPSCGGTAKRKETKRGEMGGEESERS